MTAHNEEFAHDQGLSRPTQFNGVPRPDARSLSDIRERGNLDQQKGGHPSTTTKDDPLQEIDGRHTSWPVSQDQQATQGEGKARRGGPSHTRTLGRS